MRPSRSGTLVSSSENPTGTAAGGDPGHEQAVRGVSAPTIELPAYNERIFIVGANGSGKSYFVSRLFENMPRWVAIDLKGDFGEDVNLDKQATVISDPNDRRWKLFPDGWAGTGMGKIERVLFRPKPRDWGSVDWLIGRMFDKARRMKKRYGKDHEHQFFLYCDEGLLQSRKRDTTNLAGAAVAGRSIGMGLAVTSQRLSWIPVEVRTEVWRLYAFYLSSIDEEKEVIKLTKNQLTLDQLEALGADYSFYEIRRQPGGMVKVQHYPRLATGTPRTSTKGA